MLNKKGFTIAEVLVSFSVITVILVSIISTTIYYRDRLKTEEVISQLNDFKNMVTKIVYDDIVAERIVRVERCIGTANCVNLIDTVGDVHTLKIVEVDRTVGNTKRGVYLYYSGVQYMLPDSDLGTGFDRICDFIGGFEVSEYQDRLYKVKTSFKHKDIDYKEDLLFIIS